MIKNVQNISQSAYSFFFCSKICRHGDRNIFEPPVKTTDEWSAEEFWPGGFEQLTNVSSIEDSIISTLNVYIGT